MWKPRGISKINLYPLTQFAMINVISPLYCLHCLVKFQKDNTIWHQAQASEQFLAKIKLASNKAICLITKKINKSNMYF
jgi:hypothetical protein